MATINPHWCIISLFNDSPCHYINYTHTNIGLTTASNDSSWISVQDNSYKEEMSIDSCVNAEIIVVYGEMSYCVQELLKILKKVLPCVLMHWGV